MYDPNTGRWLTEDPIGFVPGDYDLYRYVGNSPTNASDPTGLLKLTYTVVQKPTPGKDGAFEYKTRWELDNATEKGGVIIQRVEYTWDVQNRAERDVAVNTYFIALRLNNEFSTTNYPYMEAWTIGAGQKETTIAQAARKKGDANPFDDFISAPAFADPELPTKGTLVIALEARYYDGFGPPEDFKVLNKPPTGQLPAKLGLTERSDKFPPGATSVVKRRFQVTWDSRRGPAETKVVQLE
jgi:hypothetical protein